MVGLHFPPPALFDAAREFGDRESGQWCSQLKTSGTGSNCEWGFRIYRTIYTPESDTGRPNHIRLRLRCTNYELTCMQDFETGLEILIRHMHRIIFYDAQGDSEKPLDNFPNMQIWQRFRPEIISDRTTFDRAPPATIQQHFQAWIEEQGYHLPNDPSPDPSLRRASSASHRFCIIIDAEALQKLLRLPIRPVENWDPCDRIIVKVLDVECNAISEEYPHPFDEGWLWAAPRDLPAIWFDCPTLAADEMRDTDSLGRPVVTYEC